MVLETAAACHWSIYGILEDNLNDYFIGVLFLVPVFLSSSFSTFHQACTQPVENVRFL